MTERRDDWLTTRQAAAELGLSPGRVRQFVIEGRLKARKVGRDLLISRTECRRFQVERPQLRGRPALSVEVDAEAASEAAAAVRAAQLGVSRPAAEPWLSR